MILSATLSKATAAVREALGNDFIRIKLKLITASKAKGEAGQGEDDQPLYFAEMFTKTQVFHKKMTGAEAEAFLAEHGGKTFHSCVERTETEEITILANKKGKITRLVKPILSKAADLGANKTKPYQIGAIPAAGGAQKDSAQGKSLNRSKNYIIPEGCPAPFLVHLGVMTAEGKVIAAKYDKFRQINRFLEYVDDILPDVLAARKDRPLSENSPLRVVDFGSGKSYLTFAVQYFLTEVRHIDCDITGLDLKEDVIAYCAKLADQLNIRNLHFAVGDIAQYGEKTRPDIVITLHACDTATDYALDYAVRQETTGILSVPCCQHEVNGQLDYKKIASQEKSEKETSPFAPLLKQGILKERFAALATDALRAEYLEGAGYKVQVLEFIDMAHTPKNLLIRAVRKQAKGDRSAVEAEADALTKALGLSQTLGKLLGF